MKIHYDHVEWGQYAPGEYQFYIYWWPNWLPRNLRHIGLERYWIDGPHVGFGFWFFNLTWSTYYSLPPFEFCNKSIQEKWKNRPKLIQKLFAMEE